MPNSLIIPCLVFVSVDKNADSLFEEINETVGEKMGLLDVTDVNSDDFSVGSEDFFIENEDDIFTG